ncbi:MAG: hypothetical protein H7Z43_06275, partial [Clostridia bacterium]|nr:hypothetical protein [Deltaproteobacteria bacterium]
PTTKRAIEPRAVDHYAFRANMNEATHIMLREAMEVGNFESYDALFAAAVEALRTKLMKKKYAQVEKPRTKTTAAPKVEVVHEVEVVREVSNSRAISSSVRREVFIRDGGRCTFVGTHGRCHAIRFIEYHHRVAWRLVVSPHWRTSPCTVGSITSTKRSSTSARHI